ncbi:MAG: hypothetical protein RIS47_2163 [Bacteroidota bacterium]|jgi:tRNA G18 (ribose-2'-O)-methylase SpoU
MQKQLDHNEIPTQTPQHNVSLILYNVSNPLNVGSIFRLADALGARKIWICGTSSKPPNRDLNKTARNSLKHVAWEYATDAAQVIADLQQQHTAVFSIEYTNQSASIYRSQFPTKQAIALVLGDEKTGISQAILQNTPAVHIPMYGHITSLNVVQAATIILSEYLRQYLATNHQD